MSPIRFDAEDPQVWLQKFKAQAKALGRASQAAQARMAQNKVTVEDRLMRLTLNSSNAIEEITFLPPAGSASATELTKSFRDLYAQAGAHVARETLSVMATLAGDNDPSLDLIRRCIPDNIRQQMAEDEEDQQ